jgi:hypothetical protein
MDACFGVCNNNIYRDSNHLISLEENTYDDLDVEFDVEYCYTVTTNCGGGESAPSNEVCEMKVGINELQNQVNIYPNPTTGELKVTSNGLRITSVEIFDVLGRKQKAESKKENEIDISHLPDGVYFVKITIEQETVIKKIVKQ